MTQIKRFQEPQDIPEWAKELRKRIYSGAIETIRESAKALRQRYGIVKIYIEVDRKNNVDLPYAEFYDISGDRYYFDDGEVAFVKDDEEDIKRVYISEEDEELIYDIFNTVQYVLGGMVKDNKLVIREDDVVVEIEYY